MKVHCKIKCRKSNGDRFLKSIDTLERPFPMIFNRFMAKFLSFLFPHKHTLIPAITLAVPVFPSKVKWFLQIPRTINRFPIRRKFTMLEALVSHTPRTFTLFYARPGKTSRQAMMKWKVFQSKSNLLD